MPGKKGEGKGKKKGKKIFTEPEHVEPFGFRVSAVALARMCLPRCAGAVPVGIRGAPHGAFRLQVSSRRSWMAFRSRGSTLRGLSFTSQANDLCITPLGVTVTVVGVRYDDPQDPGTARLVM